MLVLAADNLLALTLFVVTVGSLVGTVTAHIQDHHHPSGKYVNDVTEPRKGASSDDEYGHYSDHEHHHNHHHDHYEAHHHHHHHHQHYNDKRATTGDAKIEALRRSARSPTTNGDSKFNKARATTNQFVGDKPAKLPVRKFNASWVQSDDNLSPQYSHLKRVACKLDKLDMLQVAMIGGLIVTTGNLPPSQNPVMRCNKERLRNKQAGDVDSGIRGAGDFNLENLRKLCDYPEKWIEFEHCVLSKFRNNDDFVLYQDTVQKARLILSPNS